MNQNRHSKHQKMTAVREAGFCMIDAGIWILILAMARQWIISTVTSRCTKKPSAITKNTADRYF